MNIYPFDEFSENLQLVSFELAQKIADPKHKIAVLSQIAHNYAMFGQKDRTIATLKQARSIANEISDLAARAKAMGELAGTYQALVGKWTDEVREILTEALEVARSINKPSQAKNQALHEIGIRYALAERTEEALQVFAGGTEFSFGVKEQNYLDFSLEFERNVYRNSIFQTLVRTKVENGDFEGALALFPQENVNNPNDRDNSFVQPENNLAFSDNFSELLDLLPKYQEAGHTEQIEKVISQALQTANLVSKRDIKLNNIVLIGQQLAQIGWRERATELLEQVVEEILTIKDSHRRNSLLSNLVQAFAEAEKCERALQVVQSMENTPDALYNKYFCLLQIGYKIGLSGQIEWINNDVLEQALELIYLMPSEDSERASNLISIAFIYFQSGQKERAEQLIERVLQEYEDLDYDTSKSIPFILMELGQYDRAFEIARSAENEENLQRLVNIYAEMGNYTQAFEVVESIQSSYMKVEALTDLASSYFKSGNKQKALELIDRGIEIARNAKSNSEEESDAECRASLIPIIARLCSDMAEYDRLLPEIEAIEDWNIQAQILNNLLRELDMGENLELFDKILTIVCQVTRNINNPEQSSLSLSLPNIGYNVADRYASIGRYDRALSTIASIEDLTTRASAFAALATNYAEKGDRVDLPTKKALQTIVENLN